LPSLASLIELISLISEILGSKVVEEVEL